VNIHITQFGVDMLAGIPVLAAFALTVDTDWLI
jgi:hypothetical protein